jgi:hypothetical protein
VRNGQAKVIHELSQLVGSIGEQHTPPAYTSGRLALASAWTILSANRPSV